MDEEVIAGWDTSVTKKELEQFGGRIVEWRKACLAKKVWVFYVMKIDSVGGLELPYL